MATRGGPFGSKNRNVSRQTVPARHGSKSQNQGSRMTHSPTPSTAISVRSSSMRSHLITPKDKVVVGLDYGTTFTSVSYSILPINCGNMKGSANDVLSVINWPSDGEDGQRKQVPTESWYSSEPVERHRNDEDEIFDENLFDLSQGQHPLLLSGIGRDAINEPEDSEMEDEFSVDFLWGYSVPYQIYKANSTRSQRRLVKRAKLMMVGTKNTNEDRKGLRSTLTGLLKEGIIRRHGKRFKPESDMWDAVDPISDYTVKVLQHTKEQLKNLHGFTDKTPVDFVMTVPTIWSPEASRVLQTSVKAAIQATAFGNPWATTADNIFLISEPEAAATFLLESSEDISLSETFIVADCGGGTVDVVTYGVSNRYPLRLQDEKIQPAGDNCGSSYLNDNYKDMLLDRLQDEDYLFKNGDTLESIVNRLIPDFENEYKRRVNVMKRCGHRVYIAGLRGDEQMNRVGLAEKRFEANHLQMNFITAVASGAVLRALDKKNGPERISQSSYGFLRHEPWQPRLYPGHERARPDESELDGEKYVATIDYFMVKGTPIRPDHQFSPFPTYHTFPIDEKKFLCEEVLYVSDTATESHYSRRNLKNADTQIAGRIIVDMTFLRDKGIITPVYPEEGLGGKEHYRVEYELVAKVEGRALRYEARYPAGKGGKVQKKGQFSIAAAFKGGTD
ncbi:hypothetical protein BOTNAR_0114g00130 [Botryotinia narcissicola]|uniref:Uncharacterized protein n=1 Tax=Botryotinia narcissicola TaxID=278944 RepID=A0A4Z1IP67_9HELO|nr:hypothetical protein BOTNAR_0114g00130 [Botryotinia narcissicola]